MVSEVTVDVAVGTNPFEMIATTFPQGTLSGAPKYMAMELIDKYEKNFQRLLWWLYRICRIRRKL